MPKGEIIPVSKFFDKSLHIRSVIKKIIAEENVPLSDTAIHRLLLSKGYKLHRRTVGKHREKEGILPYYLRKGLCDSISEK